MALDRQSIERRDFPIARRGYEPASVDAHMRAVAAEVLALREEGSQGSGESLASTAGSQVQGILQAAETTAAEIVRQAQESASQTRDEASEDATRTRAEAISRAQAHVATVSRASASLLERVEALDGEVSAVVQSVRAAAGRLSGDLAALQASMAELYDAAAGHQRSEGESYEFATQAPVPPPLAAPVSSAPQMPPAQPMAPAGPTPSAPDQAAPESVGTAGLQATPPVAAPVTPTPAPAMSSTPPQQPPVQQANEGGDLDGARLIALNMALNGDSREETSRYLAENFQLADRQRLIDEVYAAIEG